MSDLKEIIELLPATVEGRELTMCLERATWWYIGHPNLDGDFSVGLYASEKDLEGAALNLLSQFDAQKQNGVTHE